MIRYFHCTHDFLFHYAQLLCFSVTVKQDYSICCYFYINIKVVDIPADFTHFFLQEAVTTFTLCTEGY